MSCADGSEDPTPRTFQRHVARRCVDRFVMLFPLLAPNHPPPLCICVRYTAPQGLQLFLERHRSSAVDDGWSSSRLKHRPQLLQRLPSAAKD
jgi:hypothetical protein